MNLRVFSVKSVNSWIIENSPDWKKNNYGPNPVHWAELDMGVGYYNAPRALYRSSVNGPSPLRDRERRLRGLHKAMGIRPWEPLKKKKHKAMGRPGGEAGPTRFSGRLARPRQALAWRGRRGQRLQRLGGSRSIGRARSRSDRGSMRGRSRAFGRARAARNLKRGAGAVVHEGDKRRRGWIRAKRPRGRGTRRWSVRAALDPELAAAGRPWTCTWRPGYLRKRREVRER